MALRDLLRKVPALGLGRLRSPAAGSRLMSHAHPAWETNYFETVDKNLAKINKNLAGLEGSGPKVDKAMEMLSQERALSSASITESLRRFKEGHLRLMKRFEKIENASEIVLPVAIVSVMIMILAT